MKKNSPHQKTKHHIRPTSRQKGKGIEGICKVQRKMHELYHHLFGNLFPEEIVQYLNEHFWSNEYEVTITRKKKGA